MINTVPSEVTIYADASLLRRILQNLIVNAITYTPHGDVTIGARAVEANGATICWVNDNGCGIAENRLKKIFDMFETDPYKTGGVGLGLAIARHIVELHHGEIVAESDQQLKLPLVKRLNEIRRAEPALQRFENVRFLDTHGEHVLAFAKGTEVAVVVNLDPHAPREDVVVVPAGAGLPDEFPVLDLLTGARYRWRIGRNYVGLAPGGSHVLKIGV